MSVTFEFVNPLNTISVTLDDPEFGEVRYQNTNVLNRRLAGGALKTLTNTDWPISGRISLTFRKISEANKNTLITQLTTKPTTIIIYTDKYGEQWVLKILTPNNKFIEEFAVRDGDSDVCNIYSWSAEFEGVQFT